MSIKFYATLSASRLSPKYKTWLPRDIAYMLPASSWSTVGMTRPHVPMWADVAADCGGFVATKIWGDYRYSPDEYVAWLNLFNPKWAATMDFCCEQEVAETQGIVRERQQRTTEMAYQFLRDYKNSAWAWVPTIQGWEIEDYQRHATEMLPLIRDYQKLYRNNPEWRVGIGTLCARANTATVQAVAATVASVIDTPLHLWGVKLAVVRSRIQPRNVVSIDTSAWDIGKLGGSSKTKAKREAIGLTQREYIYQVQLPEYRDKFLRAVKGNKQLVLI